LGLKAQWIDAAQVVAAVAHREQQWRRECSYQLLE
jgi:hypothetical protein